MPIAASPVPRYNRSRNAGKCDWITGKKREEQSRDEHARHRADAPHHCEQHQRQAQQELEVGLADQTLLLPVERASKTGQAGRNGEHRQLRGREVHPDGGRCGRTVGQGPKTASVAAAPEREQADRHEGEDHGQEHEERLVAVKRDTGSCTRPTSSDPLMPNVCSFKKNPVSMACANTRVASAR